MSKNEVMKIEEALTKSGFSMKNIQNSTIPGFMCAELEKNNKLMLHFIARKIVNGGWSDKPLIKRIQIGHVPAESLCVSTMNETAMLIGVVNVIDKNIFVAWPIYNNTYHKTNRSFYVHVENLFKGYLNGFHSCVDSKLNIWISDEENMGKLIYEYLKYNKMTVVSK